MIGRQLALLSRNPVQTLLVSRAQPKIWQKIPQNWRTSVFWMFNCMWGCNGVRWMILSLSGYDCLKCIHLIFEMCIFCTMKIRKSHQRENRLCLTYWNLLQIICITSRIVIWSKSFLLARFQNLFYLLWFICWENRSYWIKFQIQLKIVSQNPSPRKTGFPCPSSGHWYETWCHEESDSIAICELL